LACALAPATTFGAESQGAIWPYVAHVDDAGEAAELGKLGIDMTETGYDTGDLSAQDLSVYITPTQAKALEARGVDVVAEKMDAAKPKNAALGDSPNPYFNVWRSYSEPGGIADEMRALAAANKDVMKLETIGISALGKPILAIKMTRDARNTKDGTRPALLFSAINHAREWVAAEQGRRLPIWFAQHKNDPKIKEIIGQSELWFLPIQNVDGYDYTFTCGIGQASRMCDYRTLANPNNGNSNRFWRKTIRDNDGDGIYGEPNTDGVDPNRNYPAKRAIDEEGAVNSIGGETYRGPYALSEPGNLAVDRLQRRVKFYGNINYHTDGQLLLTPVSYTTDYAPPDSTIFAAMTGTDGDSAVFPYQPQRSSDLYESNGDTIDNGYLNYGIIGWTPEMDTCTTGGDQPGCRQFSFPDDESKMEAVFQKNLAFALNAAHSLLTLDRPRNYDDDPNGYQIKQTEDIQPNRFDVSYGGNQIVEAIVRKTLGPSDIRVSIGNQTSVIPMTAAPSGERYGEVPGYYFERRRATIPGRIGTRTIVAGDVVNVIILAGGQQREFRYRVATVRADATKKRVLVVAAEDYKGKSPNVTSGYDIAPRYLNTYKTALEGLGYEVATYDVDAPPANGGTPNGVVYPQIKYPTYLGVLSHFDAVVYETGDDFGPQDVTETNPRRMTSATAQTGSVETASWAHHALLELRDYANEGGKLLVAGRNVHQPFTSTGSISATGPWTWTPDQLFGFNYPANNGGDDDLPGTAFQRSRGTSNDTWQNYLGVLGRQSGIGVVQSTSTSTQPTNNNPAIAGYPVAPKAGGLFEGMPPIVIDESSTNEPNQNADGSPAPQARLALRLRDWGPSNEPLRRERIEGDYATPVTYPTSGGAIISTRDSMTFGFGLEQVNAATRTELLKRSFDYLLPAAADTTPPTIDGFKWPPANFTATPADPIEADVTAYDNSGDLKSVTLSADGAPVGTVTVFPFQFRYTPPASAAGQTVTLTALATDKAGNKSTKDITVNVVAAEAMVESPLPIGPPTISGSPTVGSTLACLSGGFSNEPTSTTVGWLRGGAVIQGAAGTSYTLTSADLGRGVACTVSATNAAGTGDATSEELTVSAASAPSTFPAPAPAPATPAPKGILFQGSCKLASNRKSVTCTIGVLPPTSKSTRLTSTVRFARTSKSVTRSGTGSVKVTVRSTKRLKKGQKMTLKIRVGNTIKVVVLKAS
jgi:hypothetical protein